MEDKNKIRYWNNHDPNTPLMTEEEIKSVQKWADNQSIIKIRDMTDEKVEEFRAHWLAMMENCQGTVIEDTEEEKYVIQSSFVGNDMTFWRKDNAGYTANFDMVQTYNLEDAKRLARKDERIFSYSKLRTLTSRVINAEHVKGIWDCEVK